MPQTEFHSTVSETSPLVFGSLETYLTVAPEAVIVHSIVTLDLSSVEILSKPSSTNYPATIQEADGQTLKALPRKNPPPYLPKTAVVPPLNPTTPPPLPPPYSTIFHSRCSFCPFYLPSSLS